MGKTFIMNISYSSQELRVIGLQCKVDFSTFANNTLPKDILKGRQAKKE